MNDSTAPRLEDRIVALNKSLAGFIETASAYPRELVRSKPDAMAFSATEVVYHMLEVERLWQRRIRGVRNSTMKTFQQMDPDTEAREGRYNEKEYEEGILALKQARSETYGLIRSMGSDELWLVGTHSRYGEMDTYAILAKMEEHDRTHAAQLDRTLRNVSDKC